MKSTVIVVAMLAALTTPVHAASRAPVTDTTQQREVAQRDHRVPVHGLDSIHGYKLKGDAAPRNDVKITRQQRSVIVPQAEASGVLSASAQLNGPKTRENSLTGQAPSPRKTDCLPSRRLK